MRNLKSSCAIFIWPVIAKSLTALNPITAQSVTMMKMIDLHAAMTAKIETTIKIVLAFSPALALAPEQKRKAPDPQRTLILF